MNSVVSVLSLPDLASEPEATTPMLMAPQESRSYSDVLTNGILSLQLSSTGTAETVPSETSSTQVDGRQDRIMGDMEPSTIAEILCQHRVKDVTNELDLLTLEGIKPINGGGWGNIFRARMKDGSLVAVKQTRLFTSSESIVSISIIKESARELHTWSKCKDPNVMELIGFADIQGVFAMVSPWMEGGDVSAYIQEHPGVDRLDLCKQVASGLCYFHNYNMVHGDLKAQNALISGDGRVRLTDLGSSTIKNGSITFSARQTELRSLKWAPPELLGPEEARPNTMSDIYSLGMTILEIITGEVPFSGWNDMALLTRLVLAGSAEGSEGPRPSRPECCIPQTEKGDHIWKLLSACWTKAENRPSAVTVKERLNGACLDRNEMREGSHKGVPSHPVCRSTLPVGSRVC